MDKQLWFKKTVIMLIIVVLTAALVQPGTGSAATPIVSPTTGKSYLVDASSPSQTNVAGDELWSNKFMLGVNGVVRAIVIAQNGDIYLGGSFTQVAGVHANRLAKWTASTNQWSALGRGADKTVTSIAISGNFLYAAGYFTKAGNIPANAIASYKLSDGSWSNLNGGMTYNPLGPVIETLAFDGSGNLYAAGQFDTAGGIPALNIAKWDGSGWSALGAGLGIAGNMVYALATIESDVYAGGDFMSPTSHLAHWTGTNWTWSGATDNNVYALAISGSFLYVGGTFSQVTGNNGTTPVHNIASFNVTSGNWADLGGGTSGEIHAMTADNGGNLYATGMFSQAGSTPANNVAVWNGSSWSALKNPSGISDGIGSSGAVIAFSGADVYVGGSFITAGDFRANSLARWNVTDQQWYSPGNSVNSIVNAVASSGSDIYVGGSFSSAGGLPAHGVARYNQASNTWSTMDGGVNCNGGCSLPNVYAIAMNGSSVVVGGIFETAGGMAANNIAVWDAASQNWSDMGGGVTGCSGGCTPVIFTIVPDGSGVDVGGAFLNAGAVTANNVAAWYDGAWHSFIDVGNSNTGTNGAVLAIAPDGTGGYYFGGNFTSPHLNLTYFDGYDWFAPHSAPNDYVDSIVLSGNDIYIAGAFTNAAGSGANYIAKASGSGDWTPLSNNPNHTVNTMLLRGTELFAGGIFTQIGALGVNYIAVYNITRHTWSNLGSGLDGAARIMAADQIFVYVGGLFASAGEKPSQNLGRYGQFMTVLLPTVLK